MDLKRITSPQNPYVKKLVAIRNDGLIRQQEGVFLIEGETLISEALAAGITPRDLVYVPRMFKRDPAVVEAVSTAGTRVLSVSKDVYKKIADTRNPVWLAALFPLPGNELIDILQQPRGVYSVASNVQDPGNLGTMWRSAAGLGASALIVSTPACDLYNSKVLRACAGAVFTTPAVKARPVDIANSFQRAGIPVYGAEPGGEMDVEALPGERPLAVVFGHETKGIHPDIRRGLAGTFHIPQSGRVDSLNVAASCAVTLYVLSRNEHHGGG